MSLPVSFIQGPGSHSQLIEQYLNLNFHSWDSFSYWPGYQLTRVVEGKRNSAGNRYYDALTYVLTGINHRLERFSYGQQKHRKFLYNFYDHLCARSITEPKALIAWSQMSLQSMKKNRNMGGTTVLEHPMPHVDQWMDVNQQFYDDPGIAYKPGYSRFTPGMISKMKGEYEVTDYIQVHSSFAKATFMTNGIPDSKLLVSGLGIDPAVFPYVDIPKEKPNKFTILYVGRLELLKGVHLLLEVVNRIGNRGLELVLVGSVLPEIKPFLNRYSNNVRVVGHMGRDSLSLMLKKADILVLPSLNDAFGMVLLEAMAHGLPVIGSTASAAPDIVTAGVNGMIVRAGDKEDLEEALVWAKEHRNELSEMGNKAREIVYGKHLNTHYFMTLNNNLKSIGFI